MNETTRTNCDSEVVRLYDSLDITGKAIALSIAETLATALVNAAKIQIAAAKMKAGDRS